MAQKSQRRVAKKLGMHAAGPDISSATAVFSIAVVHLTIQPFCVCMCVKGWGRGSRGDERIGRGEGGKGTKQDTGHYRQTLQQNLSYLLLLRQSQASAIT